MSRVQRKSMQHLQTAAPPEGRDRKRSAPLSPVTYEDSSRPNSRTGSRLSRDKENLSASPTPRKVRPPSVISEYDNPAYVGSVTSLSAASMHHGVVVLDVQQTGVIREQYCSCARWSRLERLLLILVAVLAGAVVGLAAVVTVLAIADPEAAPGLLRSAAPAARPQDNPPAPSS